MSDDQFVKNYADGLAGPDKALYEMMRKLRVSDIQQFEDRGVCILSIGVGLHDEPGGPALGPNSPHKLVVTVQEGRLRPEAKSELLATFAQPDFVVLTTGTPATGIGAPTSPATPGTGLLGPVTTISYHGAAFEVPGWPIVDLTTQQPATGIRGNPGTCGRDLFPFPVVMTGTSEYAPPCPTAPGADAQRVDGLWVYSANDARGPILSQLAPEPVEHRTINGIDVAIEPPIAGLRATEISFRAADGERVVAVIGIGPDPSVGDTILNSLRPVS